MKSDEEAREEKNDSKTKDEYMNDASEGEEALKESRSRSRSPSHSASGTDGGESPVRTNGKRYKSEEDSNDIEDEMAEEEAN